MIINFDPQFINASKLLAGVVHLTGKTSVLNHHYPQAIGIIVRLGTTLDNDFLSKFTKLDFIATVTTGTNHIDEEYCNKKGIQIISLKGETKFLEEIHATPEHTWGLLLSLVRNIPASYNSVLQGEWDRNQFFGYELYKKRFGIIGFGRVGKILAQYAQAFGMGVCAFNDNEIDEKVFNVSQVDLKTLLLESDVVSVNLPLNKSTFHFFNAEYFSSMKKTAVLLNTSRGEIIDEKALLKALQDKTIAGAALDVLENETTHNIISSKHPLIVYAKKNQNLLISPHIAGSTFESMENTALFIADKIKMFLQAIPH